MNCYEMLLLMLYDELLRAVLRLELVLVFLEEERVMQQ